MSVTGWTHPLVTPGVVADQPYFDGRAECLVWGTWARAWQGMEIDANTLMQQCKDQGSDIYICGADLVDMAIAERKQNIWAVRFLYLHILKKGFCMRPPGARWSILVLTHLLQTPVIGVNGRTRPISDVRRFRSSGHNLWNIQSVVDCIRRSGVRVQLLSIVCIALPGVWSQKPYARFP
jgi:hypothetical protein